MLILTGPEQPDARFDSCNVWKRALLIVHSLANFLGISQLRAVAPNSENGIDEVTSRTNIGLPTRPLNTSEAVQLLSIRRFSRSIV